MKKLIVMILGLFAFVGHSSESTIDCIQKKQNFWEHARRNCTFVQSSFDVQKHAQRISDALKKLFGSRAPKFIPGTLVLGHASFALELEHSDGDVTFPGNGPIPDIWAYKHEIPFTLIADQSSENGRSTVGVLRVLMTVDGKINYIGIAHNTIGAVYKIK